MSGVTIALPDVTLMLDRQGIIRKVHLANAISNESVDDWLGQPWVDTVQEVGGDNIRSMVEDACANGVSPFRQVVQRFPSGLELPIEYNAVLLGGKSGLVAVGKNLQAVAELQARVIAAQHAREQDYWKLREVETRYRLLFDTAQDPVVLLGADDFRINEANPAAIRACGAVVGWQLADLIAPADVGSVVSMLKRVREHGRAPAIRVHLGSDRAPWMIRASLSSSQSGAIFFVQLAAAAPTKRDHEEASAASSYDALIERMPDAFVLTDRAGTIRRANRAFLDLVQAGAHAAVVGERLGRWLSQPGADASVLLSSVERHGSVRSFSTAIQGELGTETAIEISAVADSETAPRAVGMILRDTAARLRPSAPRDRLGGVLTAMGDSIGKVPLLKLVKDASDLIERHYVEGALKRSAGNRTAAAELLGLSRQSLYTKLNRFGLDGGGRNSGAED